MLYAWKGHFQKLVGRLARTGLTANHYSWAGVFAVVLIAGAFYFGTHGFGALLLSIPVLLFFRLVVNALDGLVARRTQTATAAGEMANELLDVLGDIVSYGIFLFIVPEAWLAIAAFLNAVWLCEFVGVLGRALPGRERRHESIGGGKAERAVWFGALALALYWQPSLSQSLESFFYALAVLVALSALKRVIRILRVSKGKPYESFTPYGR